MVAAVVGHQLILKVEKWIAWLTSVMTVVFVILILPTSAGASWVRHRRWAAQFGAARSWR